MNINKLGTLTQLSANSGCYLTESYPTNFHTFVTKKILVGDDAQDNYKEVTLAEKTKLEDADAKWTEPPKEFIEKWIKYGYVKNVHYSGYNEHTGYFSLNGIEDIGYEEADRILTIAYLSRQIRDIVAFKFIYNNIPVTDVIRILMPITFHNHGGQTGKFHLPSFHAQKIQVLRFGYNNFADVELGGKNITEVTGLTLTNCNRKNSIRIEGPKLVKLTASNVYSDIDLGKCPNIDQESYKYLIAESGDVRGNHPAFNITVDVNTYNALTGDSQYPFKGGTQEQWQQLVTDAAAKQITFITTA